MSVSSQHFRESDGEYGNEVFARALDEPQGACLTRDETCYDPFTRTKRMKVRRAFTPSKERRSSLFIYLEVSKIDLQIVMRVRSVLSSFYHS